MLVIQLSRYRLLVRFRYVYVEEKCSIWYREMTSSLTDFNAEEPTSVIVCSALVRISFSTLTFLASLSRHIFKPFLANGHIPSSASLHSPHLGALGTQIVCPNPTSRGFTGPQYSVGNQLSSATLVFSGVFVSTHFRRFAIR